MEHLKELRKMNSMSQMELARQIGVSRAAISKWESGDSTPRFKHLKKLKNVFKVDVEIFFK